MFCSFCFAHDKAKAVLQLCLSLNHLSLYVIFLTRGTAAQSRQTPLSKVPNIFYFFDLKRSSSQKFFALSFSLIFYNFIPPASRRSLNFKLHYIILLFYVIHHFRPPQATNPKSSHTCRPSPIPQPSSLRQRQAHLSGH